MRNTTLVRSVRLVGLLEGLSYLVLLFVAMPLKYGLDMPMPVRVVGAIHGALFAILALMLVSALFEEALTKKEGAMVAVASLVPLGPLFIDSRLRAAAKRAEAQVPMAPPTREQ